MQENLLHFIWKYKKLPLDGIFTSESETITIVDVGTHNHQSGPDFFNAKIEIGGQLWAGNVEIHLKASDWYVHRHENDSNYDNVILHVVWQDDVSVFRKDGSEIPTIALKNYVSKDLLLKYEDLFDKKEHRFINCESSISEVDSFVLENWFERLYFERLEQKSIVLLEFLEKSKNDWEQVLFAMLLKSFGLKINGDAFLSLANALDFSIVRKLQPNRDQLESVFYGLSHLLEDENILDNYYLDLKKEFYFLQHKFGLDHTGVLRPEFFRLRPSNFPTIRLSQLADLYSKHQSLFDKIINAVELNELYSIFDIRASAYWNDHYTFGKSSKRGIKKSTKKFIDLLIINTILPLKFCYAKHRGEDSNEDIISIISKIKPEDNNIVLNFRNQGVQVKNAKDGQAVIQSYNVYCTKNKCLECSVGSRLLEGND